MMDDMEAGKVNCIVTKDLSRFGREHVMMDYYLEFLFPEKRVRYNRRCGRMRTQKKGFPILSRSKTCSMSGLRKIRAAR